MLKVMLDIFYIIFVLWILWQIFGGGRRMHVFHHHKFSGRPPGEPRKTKKEGDVTITQTNSGSSSGRRNDEGEYVDFEEINSPRKK
jgi:hypothetical protein